MARRIGARGHSLVSKHARSAIFTMPCARFRFSLPSIATLGRSPSSKNYIWQHQCTKDKLVAAGSQSEPLLSPQGEFEHDLADLARNTRANVVMNHRVDSMNHRVNTRTVFVDSRTPNGSRQDGPSRRREDRNAQLSRGTHFFGLLGSQSAPATPARADTADVR
mmetsp:Transcript_29234/g.89533  ORF Transcript_29234/g.89533 Transcript_29234/m.89533 type:complete len:164 (-) Transcript_29234:617-1108(-)